eukprot:TRINITY_DN6589_c0_g1_i4.p1 TRINITY_DN6589_c0_g1~~TRINITY_DN6589_c0_g1_i4.p1  ORF type:complete len:479 (+),score=164.23 TRINITY_DN6589_c0_g1_i4:36-1472(+)
MASTDAAVPSGGAMPVITIGLGDGSRVQIPSAPQMTLAQLQREISSRTNVAAELQRLIFSGKELRGDNATIQSMGVGHNGIMFIHMVQRPAAATPDAKAKGKRKADVVDLSADAGGAAPGGANIDLSHDSDGESGAALRTAPAAAAAIAALPMPYVAQAAAASGTAAAAASGAAAAAGAMAAGMAAGAAAEAEAEATPRKRRRAAAEGGSSSKKKAPAEKRQARFRGSCPMPIMQRIQRAATQRMFLLERRDLSQPENIHHEFGVIGSTGNVYRVQIASVPSCDCPDRNPLCKHILFVYLKVLKQPLDSPHIYQAALLQSELQEIFENAPPSAADVLANQRVRKEFEKLSGKVADGEAAEEEQKGGRAIEADDECPICFEGLLPEPGSAVPGRPLVCCNGGCGKSLHKECQGAWAMAESRMGRQISCPYCRQPWQDAAGSAAARIGQEGYTNMAAVAGLSMQRDTSTYNSYHRRRNGY